MIGKNRGHINTATGRNKREMGGILKKRGTGDQGGGIRRQNGKPAERRVDWRRRQATKPKGK